jgi:hypothetical protein
VVVGAAIALVCLSGCRAQKTQDLARAEELAGPPLDWAQVLKAPPSGSLSMGSASSGGPLVGPELADALFEYTECLSEYPKLNLLSLAPATERPVKPFGPCRSTKDALRLVSEATGGAAWVQLGHGLAYCFGTQADLDRLRAGPPDSLPPAMLRCDPPTAALTLIHEFWGIEVLAEREWLQQHEEAARDPFGVRELEEEEGHKVVWVVRQLQPTSFTEWMEAVATSLGGEVEHRGRQWVFRREVDGEQTRRAAERLVAALRNEEFPSGTPEAIQLGRLGEPAVPTLVAALKPTEPVLAQAIIKALEQIGSTKAVDPLLEALKWPARLKDKRYDDSYEELRPAIVHALGRIGDARAAPALQALLAAPDTDDDLRKMVRVALGNIAPEVLSEEGFLRTVAVPLPRMQLNLLSKTSPDLDEGFGDGPDFVIRKTAQDETGEHWAAFLFARYGGSSDIWLAHPRDGATSGGYLFTGCTVKQYGARGPEARVNGLKVSKGKVRLAWSRQPWGAKREEPQHADLSLADLRRDTDGDGLTDLLERRLATNPKAADTDGDGLSDAEDGNPLVAPPPSLTDEQQIVQAAFAHLYRGDKSLQVKLVSVSAIPALELYGYGGPVLWLTDEEHKRFRDDVGCGPESVTFSGHERVGDKWVPKSPVTFADGGERARVEVSTYRDGLWGAGYHGILRKVEGRWVLIEWEMDWIS